MSRPASAEQEEKASSAMPATEVGRVRAERLDAASVCEHRGRETGTGTGFGIQVGVWRRNASHTGPDGQPAYRYIHTVRLQEKALCPTKVTDLRDNLLQCIAQNMEPSEHSPAQPIHVLTWG